MPCVIRKCSIANAGLDSDIRGGNTFKSPLGTSWSTIMVQTGVYVDGVPSHQPTMVSKNVYEAVRWALVKEGWPINLGIEEM
jgi:ribonucleotide monophosphatase NagD (HAD superfamily)